ncbi:unnamed protein product, partial [Polarella glacialis]
MGQLISSAAPNCPCTGRGTGASLETAQSRVRDRWVKAQKLLAEPAARIPDAVFVVVAIESSVVSGPRRHEYTDFLTALFGASTALMLPAVKADVGKHCFGYGCLLADEFYFDPDAGPADRLGLVEPKHLDVDTTLLAVRDKMNAAWTKVEKNKEQRVTINAFTEFCLKAHEEDVDDDLAVKHNYKRFLAKVFDVGVKMSGTTQGTLGQHCFKYAALFAGEFYFAAAHQAAGTTQDAAGGSSVCTRPVADVLRVTAEVP